MISGSHRTPSRARASVALVAGIATAAAVALAIAACDDNPSTPAPQPRLDTTFLQFGDVDAGTQQERSFTLTNVGGGVLEGTFVNDLCSPPSVPTDSACWTLVTDGAYRLEANQAKTFTLRFSPYTVSTGGGECGIGMNQHCQVQSAHGVVHCAANGIP